MLLEGKTVIITGASSGIGRAAARLFARHGARLVLGGRDRARLDAVVAEIAADNGTARAVAGDVADAATHEALVGALAPLADQAPGNWDAVMAANLTAAFLGARAQIPSMLARGKGALIFTSSFVGNSVGLPGMACYGAAKAGLLGLVRGITADYGAAGIRANALIPGGTDTAMAGDAESKAWAASLHAMKRIADPDEIAQAALFLASDMASFVSGSALWAEGGNAAVKL